MPRRPHTPAELELIETMAKERRRYEAIFSAHAAVLRTDPSNRDAAMDRMRQSALVAKRGQPWEPKEEDVDQYLAQCEDICQLVPQDFDDHVKILYAAYAALMCTINCKIAKQSESIQLAMIKRHYELGRPGDSAAHTSTTKDQRPPTRVPKPAGTPRCLTADEIQSFKIPDNLLGEHFVLSPDSEDPVMYEVVGFYKGRDKSVQYDVVFEDCDDDPIRVDAKEMLRMLEDSLYLAV